MRVCIQTKLANHPYKWMHALTELKRLIFSYNILNSSYALSLPYRGKNRKERRQSLCKINNPIFTACRREILVDYGWCYALILHPSTHLWSSWYVLAHVSSLFRAGSHWGSSCQVFYSRHIKKGTPENSWGFGVSWFPMCTKDANNSLFWGGFL